MIDTLVPIQEKKKRERERERESVHGGREVQDGAGYSAVNIARM